MVRFQILFTERQLAALRLASERAERPVCDLVRQFVDDGLYGSRLKELEAEADRLVTSAVCLSESLTAKQKAFIKERMDAIEAEKNGLYSEYRIPPAAKKGGKA